VIIRIILVLIGYCFGLLQNGYYVGRMHGIDIRTKGSGNVGATNTLRVLGPKTGALVLALDFLKAFIPCLVTGLIFADSPDCQVLQTYAGLGAILGHNFPVTLKFRGGKGVACTAGLVFAIDWRVALGLVIVFTIIAITTRLISLASITCMMLMIIVFLLLPSSVLEFKILICIIGGMSIIRHAANIERLVNGTEGKIDFGEKK